MKVKAVLVDVDGTLIDTNDAHVRAWVEALRTIGRDAPFEKIRPLIGMGGDQLLPRVAGIEKDSAEGKKASEAWSKIFNETYLPHVQPFPKAANLLEKIREQGAALIAATSSEPELADKLLEIVGAKELLTDQATAKDAKHSKPAPDIVEASLKKAGCRPEQAIMLGDTPYDIEAAKPVGVGVIAFRSGGFTDEQLRGALAIYDGPADLLEHWDHSVLAKVTES